MLPAAAPARLAGWWVAAATPSLPWSLLQQLKGSCVPDQWGWSSWHPCPGARMLVPPLPASPPTAWQCTLRPGVQARVAPTFIPAQPTHAVCKASVPPGPLQYYYLPVVSARSFLWPGLKETRAGARRRGGSLRRMGQEA